MKFKGFTLVELIVVIAIIGILAAILVPAMMGYIKSSRYKTANSNAKTIYTAASTYITEYAESPDGRTAPGDCETAGQVGTNAASTKVVDIEMSVNKYMGADAQNSYWAVVIEDGVLVEGWWCAIDPESDDAIPGCYPFAVDPDTEVNKNSSTWAAAGA